MVFPVLAPRPVLGPFLAGKYKMYCEQTEIRSQTARAGGLGNLDRILVRLNWIPGQNRPKTGPGSPAQGPEALLPNIG